MPVCRLHIVSHYSFTQKKETKETTFILKAKKDLSRSHCSVPATLISSYTQYTGTHKNNLYDPQIIRMCAMKLAYKLKLFNYTVHKYTHNGLIIGATLIPDTRLNSIAECTFRSFFFCFCFCEFYRLMTSSNFSIIYDFTVYSRLSGFFSHFRILENFDRNSIAAIIHIHRIPCIHSCY